MADPVIPDWLKLFEQYMPGTSGGSGFNSFRGGDEFNLDVEAALKGTSGGFLEKPVYDPISKRYYVPRYDYSQPQNGAGGEAGFTGTQGQRGNLLGYYGFDNTPDVTGKTNYMYDLQGQQTGTFDTATQEDDGLYKLALGMVLAMAGGAAYSGITGAGAAAPGSATNVMGSAPAGGSVGGSTGGLATTVGGMGEAGTASALEAASAEAMGAYGGSAGMMESQLAGMAQMGQTIGAADIAAVVAGQSLPAAEASALLSKLATQYGVPAAEVLKSASTYDVLKDAVKVAGPVAGNAVRDAVTNSGGNTNTGGGNGTGLNLGPLIDLITGIYGGNQQGEAADKMLDWLKSRTAITDNMYAEGSPERMRMQQEMDRKDAAAGRNSQYGTRAVDLASNIAKIKSAENTKMTTGIGQWMQSSYNQDAAKWAGLSSALGGLFQGGANGGQAALDQIISGLTRSFSTSNPATSNTTAPVVTTPGSTTGTTTPPVNEYNNVTGGSQEPAFDATDPVQPRYGSASEFDWGSWNGSEEDFPTYDDFDWGP